VRVNFAYGMTGVNVELPDARTTVVRAARVPPAQDKTIPDQWQAQVLATIMRRSRVVVRTGFLSDGDLAQVHLEQVHDIAQVVSEMGPGASVCALPEGPTTVPYIA